MVEEQTDFVAAVADVVAVIAVSSRTRGLEFELSRGYGQAIRKSYRKEPLPY